MENDGDIRGLIKAFLRKLKQEHVCDECTKIFDSRIPLLKIVESTTKISIDISFNVADGYCAVKPITDLSIEFPPLRHLVLVMKAFLRQRNLNNTYERSIGSFLLVILITAFLQYQKRKEPKYEKTFGELLIDLLGFYGEEFNYRELGISIIGEGTLFYKPHPNSSLMVENPQSPEEDLGKPVYNFDTIAKNFIIAKEVLEKSKYALSSILCSIEDRKKFKIYP